MHGTGIQEMNSEPGAKRFARVVLLAGPVV